MRIRNEKYSMTTKETKNTIEGFSSFLLNKEENLQQLNAIYDVESFIQWLHQSKKSLKIIFLTRFIKKSLKPFQIFEGRLSVLR